MEIVSRQEALSKGRKRYFTGLPCKSGHLAERSISNSGCLECFRLRQEKYQNGIGSVLLGRMRKDARLRKLYGITRVEFEVMKSEQKQLCAICKRSPGRRGFVVDHCHATGKVRGLLCNSCNLALGYLNDDPAVISNALMYLNGVS